MACKTQPKCFSRARKSLTSPSNLASQGCSSFSKYASCAATMTSSHKSLPLFGVDFPLLSSFPPVLIYLAKWISLQVSILKAHLVNLCEEFAKCPHIQSPLLTSLLCPVITSSHSSRHKTKFSSLWEPRQVISHSELKITPAEQH